MNLTLLGKVLRRIAAGELSRQQAALELECSERQVNRLMRRYGVERPAGPVPAAREAAAARRATKQKKIEAALARSLPPVKAADVAQVSVRTIYRWKAAKGLSKARKKRSKTRNID